MAFNLYLPISIQDSIIPHDARKERYRRGHNGADSKSVCGDEPHVGSNPTRSARKALKALCFQGFFCVNGALLLERYSLWCPVLWWPELLKSYKKQRVAIKRYFRYCSTSLLFFLGFSVFPFALRLSQKPFFVGARLCVVGFKDVLFSFKPHVNVS